ncbi:hypothetical protein DY000_02040454 [Brassica cretica]|uniref:Reverse transcriptase zinc-binding domain-containing protein n=1 Tax=Brassica cretica TaxID=69181 RepID=A0ABQ7BDZ8_BRACR|nr:hypothetical protein DY000_02040454 [Brassica cretica]
MWVANYDRLPTRNRLAAWGMTIATDCPFCSRSIESRDHMFLRCEYSLDVWREVFVRCHPPVSSFTDWSELLSWIRVVVPAKLKLMRKLATQTVIFHLWKQRNNLIHSQISLPAASVFYFVEKEMRNIISARKHKKQLRSLMACWLK